VAIEDTVLVWWDSFISALASTLAFDVEKLFALGILFLIGAIVAKWGKGIIAGILKKIFANEKLQKITKITPKDLEVKEGWKGLLYYIPDLFRVLILILVVSVALDLLEFEQASGIVGQVFTFVPNLIAVVLLLWVGSWLHNLGKEWFEGEQNTIFKGDTRIPKYGFYVILWGTIISISLTQLGIGTDVIPIIVGGMMGSIIVVVYGMRNIFAMLAKSESVKSQGVKEGDTIQFSLKGFDGKEAKKYTIKNIGLTHIQLAMEDTDQICYLSHQEWMKRFYIIPTAK